MDYLLLTGFKISLCYSGSKFSISHLGEEYSLPVYGLCFRFINSIFQRENTLHFDEV